MLLQDQDCSGEEMGQGCVKMLQKFPVLLKMGFFLIRCLLDFCRPLTVFQSFKKLDSDSSYILFLMFLWANESLELPGPPFCLNCIISNVETNCVSLVAAAALTN